MLNFEEQSSLEIGKNNFAMQKLAFQYLQVITATMFAKLKKILVQNLFLNADMILWHTNRVRNPSKHEKKN